MSARGGCVEWPTLMMLLACYGVWALGTTWIAAISLPLGIVVTGITVGLYSSLQHEVLHGHPLPQRWLSEALVFPGLTVYVPYLRFRDSHLDHHRDANLTDPYDDPESNYLDPAVWARLPRSLQMVLMFNNTLAGRLLVGPLISMISFSIGDTCAIRSGDTRVLRGWFWHIPALALVFWWLIAVASMPLWAYLIAAYIGFSLVKIRTFLEHQAHARASGRTVIVEDRGPLSYLFLNNNLHVVHHKHPRVPWYQLPKLYLDNKERYITRNDGYVYASYAQIFRRHLFRTKDPVPHPLWR